MQIAISIVMLTLGVALAASSAGAAEPARHRIDQEDLARTRAAHPDAARLLEAGESRLVAGHTALAADLFSRAAAAAPDSALAARSECYALTALGRRTDALAACRKALANGGTGLDFRAMVATLMSARPTPDELAEALLFARAARTTMSREPFGYAAQCDIAARLGDRAMLGECLGELERVAPDHVETARVRGVVAALRPSPWLAAGWLALLALGVATALRGVRRGGRRFTPAAAAASALLALLAIPTPARADQGMSKWPVSDVDPESSVPGPRQRDGNPLEYGYWIMDVTAKADGATKRGDHAAAVRYYRALAKAVPDRSVAFTRLCEACRAAGDRVGATNSCRAALGQEGATVDDVARFVAVVLSKRVDEGRIEARDLEDAFAAVDHLRATPAARLTAERLACDLSIRAGDLARLEVCSAALVAMAPGEPQTLQAEWALALGKGRYAEAEGLVQRARVAALPAENVLHMESATRAARPFWRRGPNDPRALLAALALGVVAGALALARWRSRSHGSHAAGAR